MYDAKVLEAFIASPSDTKEQRTAIHDTVVRWNETESRHLGVVLLPTRWETHAYPDMSAAPQPVINKQLVDRADVVVATFWTTLGSRTQEGEFATVEEITRARDTGKHVFLYFCEAPAVLLNLDTAAVDALKEFREEIGKQVLYGTYTTNDELRERLRKDLSSFIRDLKTKGDLAGVEAGAIDVAVSRGDADAQGETRAALDELRSQLRGYLTKWQSIVGSFEDDYTADSRQALAREIERIALAVVQRVGTVAPDAPVLQALPDIVSDAHRVAATMLYLDGGKSFDELTDGCKDLVDRTAALIREPWDPAGPSPAQV